MKIFSVTDSQPIISVVIPTWNRANEVIRALDSLIPLIDEEHSFEIVVTDNASTDNTVGAVQSWSEEHGIEIKILTSLINRGPVLNWINGIKHASGDYILLLFSDDFIRFTAKRQVGIFFEELKRAREFNINIIRLPVQIVDNELQPSPSKHLSLVYSSHSYKKDFSSKISTQDFLLNHLLPRNFILGATKRSFSPVSPAGYIIHRNEILSTLEHYMDKRMYKKNGAGIDQLSILNAARNSNGVVMFAGPTTIMVASKSSITHTSQSSSKKANNLIYAYHLSELDFSLESLSRTRNPFYFLLLFMSLLRLFKTLIAKTLQS